MSDDAGSDELSYITTLLWSFVPFQVVWVAVRSGVFDLLAQRGPLDCNAIAVHMGWESRPARLLVDILEIVGLTDVGEHGVRITDHARRWFTKGSELYIGKYLDRLSLLEAAYQDLEARLETDRPYPALEAATLRAFGLGDDTTPNDVRAFSDVLNATSRPIAEAFLRVADLPGDAAVLDVGAGTGVFTKLLLDRGHRGTVECLDTPAVCAITKRRLKNYATRITWTQTNWNEWEPTQCYDAIFLHHALHEEKQENAKRLLIKCANALTRHGRVYVIGIFARDDHENVVTRLFSMNIFLEVGGDNTSLRWLRSVASESGLREDAIHALPGGRTLWIATRA